MTDREMTPEQKRRIRALNEALAERETYKLYPDRAALLHLCGWPHYDAFRTWCSTSQDERDEHERDLRIARSSSIPHDRYRFRCSAEGGAAAHAAGERCSGCCYLDPPPAGRSRPSSQTRNGSS